MSSILTVMTLSLLCSILLCSTKLTNAKFLHDPSSIPIHPHKPENHSEFGFAIGYQSKINQLVVGAPGVEIHGKVYSCNMDPNKVTGINCEPRHIKIGKNSKIPIAANVKFHLGASIAATSKHFLTCAPLLTTGDEAETPDVVGTCFFDDRRYKGMYEIYLDEIKGQKSRRRKSNTFDPKTYEGGTGWTTLADEANDMLLVVKSSLQGDIASAPLSKKLIVMRSMVMENILGFKMADYYNLGFGITGGKFFSNKTVYAFSIENRELHGIVEFLDPPDLLMMNTRMSQYKYTIKSNSVGTKFGSVLAASDINRDGWDDLLVAEPLYTEEDCLDCGAIYIYLGGDIDKIGKKNYLQITGIDNLGRLGSAIAAKDIDGDGIAELTISAPYADNGSGVIYIVSGYEVNQKLQKGKKLQITDLQYTQRVKKENLHTFGFSLQYISDIDDNGCNELVAGAPRSGKALLLKCVQVITITLSSDLVGEQAVREQDLSFKVKVCADVKYPKKPRNISGTIVMNNSIIGERVSVQDPKVYVDISCSNCPPNNTFCKYILVKFNFMELGDYVFLSKAQLITDHIFSSSVFNTSWVLPTPYSKLQTKKKISRHFRCTDCKPNLSMELVWSRSKENSYVLGSSIREDVTIKVFNKGNSSYEACVWVTVKGAQLSQLLDHNECREDQGGYRCDLPRPLKREEGIDIKLLLNMDRTNVFKQLEVKAYLHEKCTYELSKGYKSETTKFVPYILDTTDLYVNGTDHERLFPALQKNEDKPPITDVQEFSIINNGKITWNNIHAKISINKTAYTQAFKVTLGSFTCKEINSENEFIQTCFFDITLNSTLKVIATTYILTSDLEKHLTDKKLKVRYNIELHLTPTKDIREKSVSSELKFATEIAVGQNKLLIGIIAAVVGILILIVIFIILYKNGFFKREQKRKLLVHRESIKQRSVRRNTHVSSAVEAADSDGLPEIEDENDVNYDCVFEKVHLPIKENTKVGDVLQIEAKAQVHC